MARKRSNARIALVVLLATALLALGALSLSRRIGATEPDLGVSWTQASAGPVAISVEPAGAAARAGLEVGDILVSADGQTQPTALEANAIGWAAGGERLEVVIRRGASEIPLWLMADRSVRPEPYAYLAVVGIAFWVAAGFIGLRWGFRVSARGSALFTLLAFALFAQLLLSYTGRADPLDWVFYWIEVVAAAFAPTLLLHFGMVVCRRIRLFPVVGVSYAVSVALCLAAIWLSPSTLGGAYRFDAPDAALEMRDRAEVIWLVVCLVVTGLILLRAHQRSASTMHRTQMRWLLRGVAFGFGPFAALYAVPWALGAPALPDWAQLVAVVPMLFVPAAFTASLVRYRLHDLDLILVRAFSELAAIVCAFAVYTAALFLLRSVAFEFLDLTNRATRYLALVCMVVSYPGVRSIVRTGIDRALYRKRYSYRATLLDWAREVTAEADLGRLVDILPGRIVETLGVSRAEVMIRTGSHRFAAAATRGLERPVAFDETMLRRLREESYVQVGDSQHEAIAWARYLFAMKVKGRVRALLAVGDRSHPEEPLTSEDCALLATLAAHLSTAIEAARLVDEVRRRADEVERLHARQEKILESSAVGLLLLDGDGRIQAWNRALEEIYGMSREDALGRRLADVFPLQVVRRIASEESRASKTGEVRIFRLSMVNRRGDRVVSNLSISPVGLDDEGARVVTFDDVSARVKLEDQVLQQERLASLGLLAAGVAHEVNTPLTGISSYTQMLLEETADDRSRTVLRKIEAQTERATRITGSLLNLARPQSTAPEAVDLLDTLHETLQLFEPQIRKRGIRVETDIPDSLPTVPGHRGKLQQVLLNLLMNARDAVGRDGTIRLSARTAEAGAVIEVEDSGPGIPEEDLPSIFDPFYTTKQRGEGTGLGLSIAYGIVKEHNGNLTVDSRIGEYTRFTIELPTVRDDRSRGAFGA